MRVGVGIDIGGSWLRVGLGDPHGNFLKKVVKKIVYGSAEGLLCSVASAIREAAGAYLESLEGIGVGAAGRLDIKRGVLEYSPHASVKGIRLVEALEAEFSKPVVLLNDCVAAVIAEREAGVGKGLDDVVYVGIGTGIGGGAIVDGRILLGKDGNAHEVGHMIIDIDGRLECSCGARGHWEAYTSGSGLPAFSRLLSEEYSGEKGLICRLRDGQMVEAKDIFSAAYCKDPFAEHILDKAAEINAIAFANLVSVYDPQLITVGGGVALKNPDLTIEPLVGRLPRACFNSPPSVKATPLGEDAPIIGALISAFDPIRSELRPE
ncbi:MAG: ROK family protein [Candidatus Verstraetearchaeota archaeon]|nr:ROK family protein [Candidatus Verstraetearchaeota archaeon]